MIIAIVTTGLGYHPVNAIAFGMKRIKTGSMTDEQEEDERTGNTQRKSRQVNECTALVTPQVSESRFQIIFKHT